MLSGPRYEKWVPGQRRWESLVKKEPTFRMCQGLKMLWKHLLADMCACALVSADSVTASRVQDLSDMVEILI